ncbi:MAG: hypothetical protein AAB343_00080 [Patescibacteria group bacterium]
MDGIKRPANKNTSKKSPPQTPPATKRVVPRAQVTPIERPVKSASASPKTLRSMPTSLTHPPTAVPTSKIQVGAMRPPNEQAHPPLSAPQKKEVIAEQYFSRKPVQSASMSTAATSASTAAGNTPRRKGPRTAVLTGLAFIAVVIGGVFAMNAFGAMVVVVTPREQLYKLEKPAVFELAGSKVSADKTVSVTRTATKKQPVRSVASGRIKIVNNFGTSPQALSARTRFMSPAGNIYRIKEAVTVPAATTEGGKIVPKSIEVTVYADQPGTAYNITDTTKFTIPGFQGSPKYQGFYGESVGVIDGGFIGESGIVAIEDVTAASTELRQQLTDVLTAELTSSAAEGFTLIPFGAPALGAAESNPVVGKPAESFEISMSGTLSGVLVRTEDLNNILEEILFEDFPAEKNSLRTLSFDGFSVLNFSEAKQASIQLSGSIRIAVMPDANQLAEDIQQAKVSTIKDVFSGYSAIESADVRFTPSWWRRIPSRTSKIHIEVLSP